MSVLPLIRPSEDPVPVLRVSDLRQWTYCPRVVWWTYVCPVGKVESFKMRQGLAKEHRRQLLQKRRTLRAFGAASGNIESNVNLYSPTLGLTGRLDMLLTVGTARYPIEIKFTHGPARLNHRLQLAGYALLLESIYGTPVARGYIVRLPDDTVDPIDIDAPLRELARKTIEALRVTITEERMPPKNPRPACCADCEYRHFCNDVDQPSPTSQAPGTTR